MTIPHWEADPEFWDTLTLGQYVMPGVWTVDFSVRREMDVKKAISTDGSRLKDKGYLPPQLTFMGQVVGPQQWHELELIMKAIHPKGQGRGKSPTPLRVVHPKTALMAIEMVMIHEVDAVKLDKGILQVELRAYEWTKPRPANKQKEAPEAPYVARGEPPAAIARYPNTRGIIYVDSSTPDDANVSGLAGHF
jgi:hypothetical protein